MCHLSIHQQFLDRDWITTEWNYLNAYFFIIRVDRVTNADLEARRCKWADELKIVHLFIFWSSLPGTLVTVNGQQELRNKWVYEAVTRKISPKRISVPGREEDNCDLISELPVLPRVYHVLLSWVYPCTTLKVKACEYHQYKDENPELTVSDLDN